MLLEKLNRAVVNSGTMEVAKATIKSSRKVFDMFSDQTYANKPVAIARELVANGIDAHVAAGTPDRAVEVVMPTELEPEFKVRDFGTGMAHDFVMGPFMAYTDGSTKDGSNDAIGGFGIGSKSPFSYTDQFTLRVVHNGILSVYTMFKDDEGIPSVGLQGQTTTDEHNGVEVSFPVEFDDMDDFRSAAQTALQYFHPLPKVENGTLNPPDYSHISAGGKWAMRPSAGDLAVIMGGVRYPVATNSLPWNVRSSDKAGPLLTYGIDLTLPIGACDVAMSREALSYTDKTAKALTAALDGIVDEVAATFATLFDKQPTKWAAQVALHTEVTNLSGGRSYGSSSGRTGMLQRYAQYKGQPLKMGIDTHVTRTWDHKKGDYVITYPKGFLKGAEAWIVRRNTYRNNWMPAPKFQAFGSDITDITPGSFGAVFVDDMEIAGKSRIRARVEEYIDSKSITKEVLVLRAPTNTDAKSIASLLTWLGDPTVINLSTLPEPARKQRQIVAGDGTVAVRPKVRMFQLNSLTDRHGNAIYVMSPSHSKRDAIKEIPYADQPSEGILVTLNAWSFPDGVLKKLKTGVIKLSEVYFVNTSDGPKLKDTKFKKFDEVYEARFEAEKNKYPDLGKWLAIADNSGFSNIFSIIGKMRKHLNLTANQQDTAFGKLVKLYDENVVPLTSELRTFARFADIAPAMPDDVDSNAMVEAFEADHPFAKQVLQLLRYNREDEDSAALLLNNL